MFIVEIDKSKNNAISYMVDGTKIIRIEVRVDDDGIHENITKSNEDWMLKEIYNSEKISYFHTDSLKKIPMDGGNFIVAILNQGDVDDNEIY